MRSPVMAVYFYDNAGNLVNPNQYIQGIDRYRKELWRIAYL